MTFSLVRSTRYLEYTTFWENDNKKKKEYQSQRTNSAQRVRAPTCGATCQVLATPQVDAWGSRTAPDVLSG